MAFEEEAAEEDVGGAVGLFCARKRERNDHKEEARREREAGRTFASSASLSCLPFSSVLSTRAIPLASTLMPLSAPSSSSTLRSRRT